MTQDGLVEPLYEREPDSVPGPFYVVKDTRANLIVMSLCLAEARVHHGHDG